MKVKHNSLKVSSKIRNLDLCLKIVNIINKPVDGEIVMRGEEESEVVSLFMSENGF